DAETMDDLIRDKIAPHDWGRHLGGSSMMVNASTWALMLTGRVVDEPEPGIVGTLQSVVRRLGEPVVRLAVARAMREMGAQFVLGRDIAEAVSRGDPMVQKGYTYSYDMLGEAARTERDAQRYWGAYAQAIASLARRSNHAVVADNPGISVKLSALHPRYEATQGARVVDEVAARLGSLARDAAAAGMGLNVDAEEADRLDLSLDVIERVLADPALAGWDGFGVVVQAYGPRALPVIDWLADLGERLDRRLMVRLVKGAYWDTEIKQAQVLGLDGFPVFTRKAHTDVSWIACARRLLDLRGRIYPQFATHNAHSVAAVIQMAGDTGGYEFQRLHGMGEALHDIAREQHGTRCRIYAPVGAHRDLLAYLVRRLLENGANSSFVHQIVDEDIPAEEIAADPFVALDASGGTPAPGIARGPSVYLPVRANAPGWDITDPVEVAQIEAARAPFAAPFQWQAGDTARPGAPVMNPAKPAEQVGTVHWASPEDVAGAIAEADAAQPAWAAMGAGDRADILDRAAALYADHMGEFMALLAREAGKTWADGIAEIREAIDFLHYYGAEIRRREFDPPHGVFGCISPWNFPLAIFTGQIAAALAAGNAVVAKPAEQTPLVAARAVALLHRAGVPVDVLACLPGDGAIGAALTSDPRIGGIAFTGSTEVAQIINRQLAKTAPEAALIAETGGLNAMIVDSTALPEQAVRDIVASAFQSAGQRCSALRVLYIQRDVEERFLEMLQGAMDALVIGDPWDIATDVGPLIDAEAHAGVTGHCAAMASAVEHHVEIPDAGFFAAPHVLRLRRMADLEREIFGPVLHVIRFDAAEIDQVLDQINGSGFGLTFGLHTRVDDRVQHVVDHVEAGNLYVNRDQIGAIVGAQPFGGQGLSGTGPKAGGPLYLQAFTRQGSPSGEELSAEGAVPIDALKDAITALEPTEWAARTDRNSQLRGLLRGKGAAAMSAAAALDPGPVDLPGPTGESNRYRLEPRGTVLCLGPGEALLDQVIQALSAGNAVVAVAQGAATLLESLADQALPLAVMEGTITAEMTGDLSLDAVCWAGGAADARALRQALADRDGPILPVLRSRVSPASYSHERAICVDTTAAGGNAALLAAAGKA
ncbi:MAG: bifunctional proline dehydrogenase/L-glutamate gamma-semialdehyde dehydrogenase PutA, partial [Pseudomonadota bacterium]